MPELQWGAPEEGAGATWSVFDVSCSGAAVDARSVRTLEAGHIEVTLGSKTVAVVKCHARERAVTRGNHSPRYIENPGRRSLRRFSYV